MPKYEVHFRYSYAFFQQNLVDQSFFLEAPLESLGPPLFFGGGGACQKEVGANERALPSESCISTPEQTYICYNHTTGKILDPD